MKWWLLHNPKVRKVSRNLSQLLDLPVSRHLGKFVISVFSLTAFCWISTWETYSKNMHATGRKSRSFMVLLLKCLVYHRPGCRGWCCGALPVLPVYPVVFTKEITGVLCCSCVSELNMSMTVVDISSSLWILAHDCPFSVDMKAIQLFPISEKIHPFSINSPTCNAKSISICGISVIKQHWFFTTTKLQFSSTLSVKGLLDTYYCSAARRKRSYQVFVKDTFFVYWKCWFILFYLFTTIAL